MMKHVNDASDIKKKQRIPNHRFLKNVTVNSVLLRKEL